MVARRLRPVIAAAREAVAAAGRRLAAEGLVRGGAGNVSACARKLVAVTPAGAALENLRADEIAVTDLDGAAVEGPFEPTSELALHLALHRRRGDGAVVHSHPPVATALSCVLDEVPVVHYEMALLGGAVRVAPYARFATRALADGVLEALEERRAALLSGHGAVVHAASVEEAVELTVLLEWACTVYWRAAAVGAPRTLGEAEVAEVREALERRLRAPG